MATGALLQRDDGKIHEAARMLALGGLPAAGDIAVNRGQPVEPTGTVFGDPSVRDDVEAHLASSGSHASTIQFLDAALDLLP